MQNESRREILAFFLIAIAAFLWVCLLTHTPEDYLGPVLPVHNACGPVGALVSFHLVTWVGKLAAYGLSTLVALLGLAGLFRKRVEDLGWKVFGILLMTLALSSLEVALQTSDTTPGILAGGFYGQFFYHLLLDQLSSVGTYLLLATVMLTAFIVSTDTLFYPAFVKVGEMALDRKRWGQVRGRLSEWKLPTIKPQGDLLARTVKAFRVFPRRDEDLGDAVGTATLPRVKRRVKRSTSPAAREETKALEEEPSDGPSRQEARRKKTPAATTGREKEPDFAEEDPGGAEETTENEGETEETTSDVIAERKRNRPPLVIRQAEPAPLRKHRPTRPRRAAGPYRLPPLELLNKVDSSVDAMDRPHLEQVANKIEETLKHFKIDARVVEVQKGPTITQYEITLAAGIKVNKITTLADDLAMALKAASIRIVAPIPGKSTVGIEVPNRKRSPVGLRELLEAPALRDEDYKLPLAIGKDIAGAPVIGDLGEMPHVLIAGSTGSGKSVAINSIIINILMTRSPDEVKLILVDPKMVELAQFENIPHLLAPVVTDMKKAPAILGWTVDKMEERYEMLAAAGVRHISSYNALGPEKLRQRLKERVDPEEMDSFPVFLPFIVVVIDELADLMMTASKEVEASITRLSQKSRAVGIHVILATQRPSVDVITGLIKANMPSRISFHVASRVDSRTILDRNGAEKLLGKGDMLYLPPGTSALRRVQGTFISDKEIRDVVKFAVGQAEPQFSSELTRFGIEGAEEGAEEDDLFEEAVRIVLESQRGSVTLLQRQLQIGYTRASRLMELMNERGLVGPFKGSKAREVYYTLEEWEEAKAKRQRQKNGESPHEIDDDLEDGDLEEGDVEERGPEGRLTVEETDSDEAAAEDEENEEDDDYEYDYDCGEEDDGDEEEEEEYEEEEGEEEEGDDEEYEEDNDHDEADEYEPDVSPHATRASRRG